MWIQTHTSARERKDCLQYRKILSKRQQTNSTEFPPPKANQDWLIGNFLSNTDHSLCVNLSLGTTVVVFATVVDNEFAKTLTLSRSNNAFKISENDWTKAHWQQNTKSEMK